MPIYAVDPIVRRAPALQRTADARPPVVGIPSELAAERGIVDGTPVRVSQGGARVVLPARVDPSLAANVIRIAAAHPLTAPLGPMFGTLTIEALAGDDGGAATAVVARGDAVVMTFDAITQLRQRPARRLLAGRLDGDQDRRPRRSAPASASPT